MIDIVERSKHQFELFLHFVNKQYDPMLQPEIKRYVMNIDKDSQEFLVQLQREVEANSQFYSKVCNWMQEKESKGE